MSVSAADIACLQRALLKILVIDSYLLKNQRMIILVDIKHVFFFFQISFVVVLCGVFFLSLDFLSFTQWQIHWYWGDCSSGGRALFRRLVVQCLTALVCMPRNTWARYWSPSCTPMHSCECECEWALDRKHFDVEKSACINDWIRDVKALSAHTE